MTHPDRSFSRRQRRFWLRLGAALAITAGCAVVPVSAAAPEPVRIALIEGLSGSFANAGEAVWRNLQLAVERVNARGGVKLRAGARPLELIRHDSKGSSEEALARMRAAADRQACRVLMQGNSSATTAAMVDALNKHNQREPDRRMLLLNYSAGDPALTNEKCSFWHFRFDAHADMRLAALSEVLAADPAVRRIYLIGQDYSFGQHVLQAWPRDDRCTASGHRDRRRRTASARPHQGFRAVRRQDQGERRAGGADRRTGATT